MNQQINMTVHIILTERQREKEEFK